ncbi:hypothetical protein EW145_g7727 [Phellinidium pouzarii]|uniref:Uncharacterized protein n=1 Tax=Phellinidium pouzarii TaxID=167371 RepID=A0A4S4KF01_9AGAM|nr:hypothetical protein EW145_g7727 [Phellinidium pouzarii]
MKKCLYHNTTPFKIPIPLGHLHPDAPIKVELPIKEFYHRSLTGIIRSVFGSRIASNNFCYEPYELRFKPLTEVLHLTRVDADDNFPRAVVALQFWSDRMAATNFGNAKIWPAYVQFGNQSKYERSIPSSKSIHHFAHIPSACVPSSFLLSVRSADVFFLSKLPDTFQDFIRSQAKGEKASDDLQTHCRREIMHGVWKVILDDDLRHAWQFGMVVECGDRLIRRLYPRIFTYSADYPEKVLLATIKALGSHPCPCCLVHKKDIHRLGQKRDDLACIKLLHVDDDTRRCKVDNAPATMHTLAKLQMHTDATAAYLRESTKQLADALRKFKTITCVEHATAELPQEAEKRLCREAAIQSRTGKGKGRARVVVTKDFSLSNPKLHFLGDYVHHILLFGTTDSYSTSIGESEHKTSKDNYKQSNKVKVTKQLTDADQRKTNLNVIDNRIKQAMNVLPTLPADATGLKKDVPDLALHYHIGKAGEVFHLRHWLIKHRLDPATKDFHMLFFDYIIAHLTGRDAADEPTFSEEDRRDNSHAFGDKVHQLERVHFVTEEDSSNPFGFINPSSVVRAIHLILAFHYGRTDAFLGPSALTRVRKNESALDWESFYVNKFADRDLFMHHRGGGIGHTTGFNSVLANHVPDGLYSAVGVQSFGNTSNDETDPRYENVENANSEDDLDEDLQEDIDEDIEDGLGEDSEDDHGENTEEDVDDCDMLDGADTGYDE